MHRILGTRRILFALMLCVMAIGSVDAQQSLTITSESIQGSASATLDIDLTSTADTEGFVLAIGIDQTLLAVNDLSILGTATDAAGAELAVAEVFANGATLGVVLDSVTPFNGQVIAAGTDQTIARLSVTAQQLVTVSTDTAVTFLDGVLNSPPLSNLLVQGGLSVDANGGLGLNDGLVTLLPPPPSSLIIENASVDSDSTGAVRILLDNDGTDTQGFVLSVAHLAADVTLESIDISGTVTETVGAELVVPQIFPNGGTLGVVLDFSAPFGGQAIPAGLGTHIANYNYSCNATIEEPAPALTTPLSFADGQFGSPALENLLVIGGTSVNPGLTGGTLTCDAVPPPPASDTVFSVGPRELPTTGAAIGECFPGEEFELCLFYTDPTDSPQGLQMALCFDSDLTIVEGSFTVEGTIVDEMGAEFINQNVDNDPNDGDGSELLIGILMDALPPFENQMLPATATPLMIGCVQAIVSPTAACGDVLAIDFCNDINGAGSVDLKNIAVINYNSELGIGFEGGGCMIVPETVFRRGDCNMDQMLDLSDAATTLGYQFEGLIVGCKDACDANDDGKLDLADSVYILNYLFIFGPTMPAPGPLTPGPDPTEDNLGCAVTPTC